MTNTESCSSISYSYLLALSALSILAPPVDAAGFSGAIFTTDQNGTVVNANTQYASKCDVYLDGGPGPHAPAKAAGLPAGDYYFQVTDPSGGVLLSTDPVSNRRFRVGAAGVITAFVGTGGPVHPIGSDQDHPELGAVTIRLATLSCPTDFGDTPNQGGVYKVWVTPVQAFVGDPSLADNPCSGGCFHGFVSSKSKTDDFKARATASTYCISVTKQILAADGTIGPGANWEIHLTDPTGTTNTSYTDDAGVLSICDLSAGSYLVEEITTVGLGVLGLTVNGLELPPDTLYSFTLGSGLTPPSITFLNGSNVPQ